MMLVAGRCLPTASILRSTVLASKQDQHMSRFGQRVRQLRQAREMSLRDLASLVGVGFTYVSKVENGRLDFGDFPSESLIQRLAEALGADEDELLLLAEKIPEKIKTMVLRRPDAFRKLADLDGRKLDQVLRSVGDT